MLYCVLCLRGPLPLSLGLCFLLFCPCALRDKQKAHIETGMGSLRSRADSENVLRVCVDFAEILSCLFCEDPSIIEYTVWHVVRCDILQSFFGIFHWPLGCYSN